MADTLPALPPISAAVPIVQSDGRATAYFQQALLNLIQAVNGNFQAIQAQVDVIAQAQAAAASANAAAAQANAAADTAQTAAVDANAAASTVGGQNSLSSSYVTGLTLTATDAGADVTITTSANTRVYGDGSQVAVAGGSITGQAYSTSYYIYYDDAARAGGAVTYHSTTNIGTAGYSATNPNRHYVGAVVSPAAAAPPITGIGAVPSNVGLPQNFVYA